MIIRSHPFSSVIFFLQKKATKSAKKCLQNTLKRVEGNHKDINKLLIGFRNTSVCGGTLVDSYLCGVGTPRPSAFLKADVCEFTVKLYTK